jgi:hypothetical protein
MSKMSRSVNIVLQDRFASYLKNDEMQRLWDLRGDLEVHSRTLKQSIEVAGFEESATPSAASSVWVRCVDENESDYYVNTSTAEVARQMGDTGRTGQIFSLSDHATFVDELVQRTHAPSAPSAAGNSGNSTGRGVRFSAVVEMQEINDVRPQDSNACSLVDESAHALTPMRRRPHSKHQSISMAWKYFGQVGCAVSLLWVSTLLWIAIFGRHTAEYLYGQKSDMHDPGFFGGLLNLNVVVPSASADLAYQVPIRRSVLAEQVLTTWPHKAFRPMALACTASNFVVGERFAVHTADVSFTDGLPHLQKFAITLRSPDIPAPWSALGAAAVGKHLILLEREGAAVLEYPSTKLHAEQSLASKRWKLGPSAGFTLKAIAGVGGSLAASTCTMLGQVDVDWALYGATNNGEIVTLCPFGEDLLEPVQVITQLESGAQLSGMAADFSAGRLWILTKSKRKTELRKFGLDGAALGIWQVPIVRQWALGLCALSGEEILAIAQTEGPDKTQHPELWRFRPHMTSEAPQDTSSPVAQ